MLTRSLACPSILLLFHHLLLITICSLFSSTGLFSSVCFLSLSPIKLVVVCVSKIKLMFGYHGTFSFLSTCNTRVRMTNTFITTNRERKRDFFNGYIVLLIILAFYVEFHFPHLMDNVSAQQFTSLSNLSFHSCFDGFNTSNFSPSP